MACLHIIMYNNQNSDQKPPMGAPMSPRISFSNDFVESSGAAHHYQHHHLIKNERSSSSYYRDAPVSSDFEFCVSNYPMTTMTADELFSKGRLLPYKDTARPPPPNHKPTTLKDELLLDDGDLSLKPPKSSTRWKGLLGLRKSHIGSKRADKNEDKRDELVHGSKTSREGLHGGGSSSSCRDSEFGFD